MIDALPCCLAAGIMFVALRVRRLEQSEKARHMAMTNQKILEAVRDLHSVLMLRKVSPVRFNEREQLIKMSQLSTSAIRGHLAFICEEIPRMLEDGRREKVMRWLGWLQGATWALNYASLDSLKRMNMPPDEAAK